jgi:hypothetical protein
MPCGACGYTSTLEGKRIDRKFQRVPLGKRTAELQAGSIGVDFMIISPNRIIAKTLICVN